jgi:ferritin-like metal-binding protein YciE
MTEAVRLIDETLQEEKKTDEALTGLALAGVNSEALAA